MIKNRAKFAAFNNNGSLSRFYQFNFMTFNKKRLMPWINWGIAVSFVLSQFFLQAASGLMAASWQRDFHLNTTQLGFLSSVFFIAYVGMQIPVGLAYDRFGARKILLTASILLCLGTFGLSLSHTYGQAIIARILMGFGSSFGFVGMLYTTSSWFSSRYFALLVGLAETLAMIGVALAEIIMGWVILHYGWRVMLYIAGSAMFLVNFLIYVFVRDRKANHTKAKHTISLKVALVKTIKNKQVWFAGLYGFATFAVINVVVGLWGIPFLTQYHNLSLPTASSMMSMVFIGTAIGGPFNAWFVDRWLNGRLLNRQFSTTLFALLTTILFGVLIYIPNLSIITGFALLFLIGFFSSIYIQVFAIVKDHTELNLRATALAATNMLLMASAPVLQPVIGKLLALNYSFPQALTLLEVIFIIAIGLSFNLDKKN
ncbi:MFS transporter [Legionella gresilensis]|uniref:MFS transporter n=1 Tax=Legionella gresilensis TaxID=91823 RepID=UPI00104111E8|nr:MFS transporter [Legionella gresilensis]